MVGRSVGRRDLLILGGATAVWPRVAAAQPSDRMRIIAVLMGFTSTDPEANHRLEAFRDMLRELGWTEGDNMRIEARWAGADFEHGKDKAAELVGLAPEVIFCTPSTSLDAVLSLTHKIPVVFVGVSDPVGGGFVTSLARPGGNITGFSSFDPAMGGKWVQVLQKIAPGVKRMAVLLRPETPISAPMERAAAAAGSLLGIAVSGAAVHNGDEIERAISIFARQSDGGLIVLPNPANVTHRALIVGLAAHYRIPTIYPFRYFATLGGLATYGIDLIDQSRGAAIYVNRILRGQKPADLPVQAPTKFQFVINLKTARALGLSPPSDLLASADEVIE
jgi:putative tryptophan/tyrosine transport system substrate-binding protein